jgi:hypothetical protein
MNLGWSLGSKSSQILLDVPSHFSMDSLLTEGCSEYGSHEDGKQLHETPNQYPSNRLQRAATHLVLQSSDVVGTLVEREPDEETGDDVEHELGHDVRRTSPVMLERALRDHLELRRPVRGESKLGSRGGVGGRGSSGSLLVVRLELLLNGLELV